MNGNIIRELIEIIPWNIPTHNTKNNIAKETRKRNFYKFFGKELKNEPELEKQKRWMQINET